MPTQAEMIEQVYRITTKDAEKGLKAIGAEASTDDLVTAAFAEIDKIKENGVSDEDLQKVKETQRRNREENLKQNRFWLNQISGYYYNKSELETFFEAESLTEGMNSSDLQEAAKKYINTENYVKVVLMPEE